MDTSSERERLEDLTRQRLLNHESNVIYDNLSEDQKDQLAHLTVKDLDDNQLPAPNILDPATKIQVQEPFHKYEQDEDFLYAINNMPLLFSPADKVMVNIREYYAHYKRFAIMAPELTEYLLKAEEEHQLHSNIKRPPDHTHAYRLAYEIMSQLVCEGDPHVEPGDIRVLYH